MQDTNNNQKPRYKIQIITKIQGTKNNQKPRCKIQTMTDNQDNRKMLKKFDLEERTTRFAKAVIRLCKDIPRGPINDRLIDQVVGSAGSVGANYREANDALGKNDFLQRMRISRREAKESNHWLELILEANENKKSEITPLVKEVIELKNILSSIIAKVDIKK